MRSVYSRLNQIKSRPVAYSNLAPCIVPSQGSSRCSAWTRIDEDVVFDDPKNRVALLLKNGLESATLLYTVQSMARTIQCIPLFIGEIIAESIYCYKVLRSAASVPRGYRSSKILYIVKIQCGCAKTGWTIIGSVNTSYKEYNLTGECMSFSLIMIGTSAFEFISSLSKRCHPWIMRWI